MSRKNAERRTGAAIGIGNLANSTVWRRNTVYDDVMNKHDDDGAQSGPQTLFDASKPINNN